MAKTALITGVTGQDGAYLAELLLEKGYEVHGIKRRASSYNTERVDHLYQDPHEDDRRFILHYGDLTDATNLIRIIQEVSPDEIYNLGAQSHVAVSYEMPQYTAKVDDHAELEDVIGGLTGAQQDNLMRLVELPVGQVEVLLTSLGSYQCDACGKDILFMATSPGFRCPGCASVMWFKGAAPPASGPTPEQPPAPATRPRLRPIRRR